MPARTTASSNGAQAWWNDLGVIGGGIITGKAISEAECYQGL